jgi:hypothetical protein
MAIIQRVSSAITSSALIHGHVFPYVTHPFYGIAGGHATGRGGIVNVAFAPLVKITQRSTWETYTVEHHEWHTEIANNNGTIAVVDVSGVQTQTRTRQLQEQDDNSTIPTEIWRWEDGEEVLEDDYSRYAPLWQIWPLETSTINVNLFSDHRVTELYSHMLNTNKTIMSFGTQINDLYDFAFGPDEQHLKEEPHGLILDPVFESFEETPKIVGFLVSLATFETFGLSRLLPVGTDGIIAVITDNCNNLNMSYELNGPNATFLGFEDLHDPNFDSFEANVQLDTDHPNGCIQTVSCVMKNIDTVLVLVERHSMALV